jgi:hypothetical protein
LFAFYGCETSCFTLRESCRLGGYEKRMLKKIFGLEMEEVTGGSRKLHNEELGNLCSSPNIMMIN